MSEGKQADLDRMVKSIILVALILKLLDIAIGHLSNYARLFVMSMLGVVMMT